MRVYYLSFFFLLCSSFLMAQEVEIRAAFEPNTLQVNEQGVYKISISGTTEPMKGNFSKPEGLEMYDSGRSQRIQIINGKTEAIISYNYRVRASQAGEYTIPAYPIVVSGKEYTAPSATLVVTPANTQRQGLSSNTTPSNSSSAGLNLELELPRSILYVGETVPAKVKLYIPYGTRIAGNTQFPSAEGDAFAVSPFEEQIDETEQTLDGIRYNIVTFSTQITPLKSGEHDLNFLFEIATQEPLKNSNIRDRGPFNSMFDSFFEPMQTIRHDLSTGPDIIRIEALPEHSEAIGFSGAIGQFSISRRLHSNQANVGDPVTLELSISGEGNFNRIEAPNLDLGANWKTYEPESTFNPDPSKKGKGTKTFNYVIIPLQNGSQLIPEMPFSYFDPELGQFSTQTLPPLKLEVTGDAYVPETNTATENNAPESETTNDHSEQTIDAKLIEIKPSIGKLHQTLTPIITQTWFLASQAILLALFMISLYCLKRKRRLAMDSDYAHRKETEASLRSALKKARAHNGHAAVFYAAACEAIQASVALHNKQPHSSLIASDIELFLKQSEADADVRESSRHFFDTADAIRYGGEAISKDAITAALARLEQVIKALEDI